VLLGLPGRLEANSVIDIEEETEERHIEGLQGGMEERHERDEDASGEEFREGTEDEALGDIADEDSSFCRF
jgi:hypothetical protein